MADLSYTVDINGNPALATLKKIEGQLGVLTTRVDKLQSKLAALFTGASVISAVRFADSISDVSKATGVATENILGFTQAVQANGGSAEQASQMLIKLGLSIEEANSGALKAVDSFSEIGVTLNDLKNLSDTDLFAKTILGLSKIEDNSKRAALATKLLGKGAKGVDFAGVGGDIGKATAAAAQYKASIESAAQLNDTLSAAFTKLQLAVMQSIKPLADWINNLKPEQIDQSIKAIIALGTALTALTITIKVFEGAALIFASWQLAMAAAAAGAISLATTGGIIAFQWGKATAAFIAAEGAIAKMGAIWVSISVFFTKRIPYIIIGLSKFAGVIGIIIGVLIVLQEVVKFAFNIDLIDEFTNGISKAYNAAKKFVGLGGPSITPYDNGPDESAAETARLKRQQDLAKQINAEREQMDARAKAFKEFKLQQTDILRSYQEQNAQVIQRLGFEAKLIGMSESDVEIARAKESALENQRSIILDLVKQQEKLSLAMTVPNISKGELADLQNRYGAISNTILKIQKETGYQVDLVEQYVSKIQVARSVEKDRQQIFEDITKQMERQATLGDQIKTAYDKLKDVNFEQSQMKRSPLEKQMATIQEDARKAALAASQAFAAGFEGMDLNSQQAKELADGLEKIAQAYGKIAEAQTDNLTESRTWEQGWADAFNSYMDNATNASQRAGEAFSSITSNMNSAIDNFVTTGKFKFGDFARSIIQDLLKIELKAQATSLLKAAGGLGGLLSGIGKIFGFADGGSPPVNKPSIVGENGPELFVPKTAGTVIPNGGSTGTVNNYITNNNVSAIDGQSVARFFAENRRTLLGSMQMAQKELPYGNR